MSRTLLLTVLGLGLTTCPRAFATEPAIEKPGIIFVVGGVGGIDVLAESVRKLGLAHEVRDLVWTHGKGRIIKDLQDTPHIRKKAAELAAEIRRAHAEDPERPLFLIGKSGGAGLSLLAAEQLPPHTLQRLILLSPAVTPTYDVRPALRATRGEVVSYYSGFDWFVLGWGTWQFGTVDCVKGPSAGLCGFEKPANMSPADRDLYARFVQVRWSPSMIGSGNPGGHLANSMPAFIAKEVKPWLRP